MSFRQTAIQRKCPQLSPYAGHTIDSVLHMPLSFWKTPLGKCRYYSIFGRIKTEGDVTIFRAPQRDYPMFTGVRARWAGVRGKVGLGAAMSGASNSRGQGGIDNA